MICFNRLFVVAMSATILASCNNISYDDGDDGSYPMNFTIEPQLRTRFNGDVFETGDKFGLYVTTTNDGLAGARYYDNKQLIYQNEVLDASETLHFPNKSTECHFIAYFPYSSTSAQAGTNLISVNTLADQSIDANYYNSNFAVAELSSKPGANELNLEFYQTLCKFEIEFTTDNKDIYDAVLASSSVSVGDLFTTASYDVAEKSFKNLSTSAQITLNGKWSAAESSDGKYTLKGMQFIAIPQVMTNSSLALSFNNKNYTCKFPTTEDIKSGNKYTIYLEYGSGTSMSTMKATMAKWNEGGSGSAYLEETPYYFDLLSLDFANTSIYMLYNSDDKLLGQVCREYLSAEGIDATAIVYYQNCNLQRGTLLQVVGSDDAKCGGSVSWSDSGVLTYVEGTSSKISTIFIDNDGVAVDGYSESICSKGTAKEYMLEDDRDGASVTKYPIVKIGTQYWMGDQLKAMRYNDGTSIDCNNSNLTTANAGYYTQGTEYFYNTSALLTLKLAPTGWRIPTTADNTQLSNYLGNEAHKLKSGDKWDISAGITLGSNLTGFGALPIGAYCYDEKGCVEFDYENKYFLMWLFDDTGSAVAEKGMALASISNEIRGFYQTASLQAYSVRCIRSY